MLFSRLTKKVGTWEILTQNRCATRSNGVKFWTLFWGQNVAICLINKNGVIASITGVVGVTVIFFIFISLSSQYVERDIFVIYRYLSNLYLSIYNTNRNQNEIKIKLNSRIRLIFFWMQYENLITECFILVWSLNFEQIPFIDFD